ncbi:MAG: hypothetical protein H6817_01980 [Phycisphaerales bacterium]|nr:hypothetical protein [Phycisphaerales bacterium]
MNQIPAGPIQVEDPSDVLTFETTLKIGRSVALAFGFGLLMLVATGFMIILELLSHKNTAGPNPAVTCVAVMGAMAVLYGITLLRSPVRAIVSHDGLTVEHLIARKRMTWADIAELQRRSDQGLSDLGTRTSNKKAKTKRVLVIKAESGKTLARVTEDLKHFNLLVTEIEQRSSAARGEATYDFAKQADRLLVSQRRQKRWLGIAGVAMFLIGLVGGAFSWQNHKMHERLANDGEHVDAVVQRQYMFNVTARIEYTFTDERGAQHTRDVGMDRDVWNELAEGDTVLVRYLPDDPEYNQLVVGEEEPEFPFALEFGSLVVIGVLGLVCLLSSLFGIADIKSDGGKVRAVRVGDVTEAWTLPPMASPVAGFSEAYTSDDHALEYDEVAPEVVEAEYEEAWPEEYGEDAPPPVMPTGLKVVAIMNMVMGGLGVIGNGMRILLARYFLSGGHSFNLGDRSLEFDPTQINMTEVYALHCTALVLALALAISGIGVLRMRRWGRWTAVISASLRILMGVHALAISLMAFSKDFGAWGDHGMAARAGMAGACAMELFFMAYPVVVLFVLCRRSTSEFFHAQSTDVGADQSGTAW